MYWSLFFAVACSCVAGACFAARLWGGAAINVFAAALNTMAVAMAMQ